MAVWCFQLHTVGPEVDAVIRRLYVDVLGSYWPPERRLVEAGYRTLPFPFEEITPPPFRMIQRWDLGRLIAYLSTWSSSQRYRAHTGTDPLDQVRRDLEAAWGDFWPLHLRVGRVSPPG